MSDNSHTNNQASHQFNNEAYIPPMPMLVRQIAADCNETVRNNHKIPTARVNKRKLLSK